MSNSPQKKICLYLHVHQPYRLTKVNYLDLGHTDDYFLGSGHGANEAIIHKVAGKSYLPTNEILLRMLKNHPEFKLSLSITGTVLEQFEEFAPEVIESFRKLIATGRVEILSETYYHSLASIYSVREFADQVAKHRQRIKDLFDYDTVSFRNTELVYNDEIASLVKALGFKAIIAEGWDPILGWRSPNYVYRAHTHELDSELIAKISDFKIAEPRSELKLLLKNYKLSDDVAFRFSNRDWEDYPLDTGKYFRWLEASPGEYVNLFMDYESFGEHQWEDTGIFEFLEELPAEARRTGIGFETISEAADTEAHDSVSMPELVSWADMERDLSAWTGNKMQRHALDLVYQLEEKIKENTEPTTERQWGLLQSSDHFYYMSTKYWNDGDVHKYFSPYDSPYEAFVNYMNVLADFSKRIQYVPAD